MSKTIMVTGATAGIGEATARIFAQHNYKVIITGRRQDRLDNLKKELEQDFKAKVLTLVFDVQDKNEVNTALNSLPQDWKDIDILVNNAGLASGLAPIQDGDMEDWEKMIDTNIKGLLYVSKAIIPGMVKRKSGHIFNLGSIAGKEAYPNGNVYCATKHAVDALSRSFRIDLLPHQVKVTNIAPGMVETEFSVVRFHGDKERAKQAYNGLKPLSGADIADVIYFAATRPYHVNINDIVITPLAQAMSRDVIRE